MKEGPKIVQNFSLWSLPPRGLKDAHLRGSLGVGGGGVWDSQFLKSGEITERHVFLTPNKTFPLID